MRPHHVGGAALAPALADHALAGLVPLLDDRYVGTAVEAGLLASTARVLACRPVYVRYKPGTNCIAAYEAEGVDKAGAPFTMRLYGKALTVADYGQTVEKLAAKRWIRPPVGLPLATLDDERIVLFAFPNDGVLDGLRLLSHPKKIQRALYDHASVGDEDQWRISDRRLVLTTIRHKPEKRVVTRVDTRARHRATGEKRALRVYLRTYRDQRGAAMGSFMAHMVRALAPASGVGTPEPLAYLADRRTLMVADAPGATLTDLLAGPDAHRATARAGAAMAAMHACPPRVVPVRGIDDLLGDAVDTAGTLAGLLPGRRDEIAGLMADLTTLAGALPAAAPGLVHGDCHHGQFLLTDTTVNVLDYDRAHAGTQAFDLGNFIANLVSLDHAAGVPHAEALADVFLSGYHAAGGAALSGDERRFWTAYGLFQLSVGPFRRFEANWARRMSALLDACGEVLS
jgi:aminoglycoside phosphotransferase (APT) family kinase protein